MGTTLSARIAVASAAALAGTLVFACASPTQITLRIVTNVPSATDVTVAIWAGDSVKRELSAIPQTTASVRWGRDGEVGTLAIVPAGEKSAPVRIRVAMGFGRDPATCSFADGKSCIIARRRLSFQARGELRLPVALHLACKDVPCDEDSTCNAAGLCVASDSAACSSDGECVLEGDRAILDRRSRVGGDGDAATKSDSATDGSSGPSGGDGSAPLTPSQTVAAGESITCAVVGTGVKCWGLGAYGLGYGDSSQRGDGPGEMGSALPLIELRTGRTVRAASAGRHICALLDNASVQCWGYNFGTLGLGDSPARGNMPQQMGDFLPNVELGDSPVARVVATYSHSCAIFANGGIKCWGVSPPANGYGDTIARGDNANEMGNNLPFVDVGPGRTVIDAALAYQTTCVILNGGSVKCWGINSAGGLGYGDGITRGAAPNQMGTFLPEVDLGPGRTATQIAAGEFHICAILDNRTLKCWGGNVRGQLGIGDTVNRGTSPNQMGADLPAVSLGTGRYPVRVSAGSGSTCVLLDNDALKCWGSNSAGQLGYGDTAARGQLPSSMGDSLPVVDLGTGRTAREVSMSLKYLSGTGHTCARLDNGDVKCWGLNDNGQLGYGDVTSRGVLGLQMGDQLPAVVLQ